jgi:repressor of nif and glnA expression
MRLLGKVHTSQRRLIEILRVIDEMDKPVGASAISDALFNRGYELGERAVRYNLKILDELGFTKKHGYSGRMLTPLGMRELNDALVNDRIGFVNTRIEEFMYRTTFDPVRPGMPNREVIANISLLGKADYERAAKIMRRVFDAGYTISNRIAVLDEGKDLASYEIPEGCLGIATICSITMDGVLLKRGVPVNTTFAGVVEVMDGDLSAFTDLIAYAGSSLDPMRVFMARRMTRVTDATFKGRGRVLANVREVPLAAEETVRHLLEESKAAGMDGLMKIGSPGEPILGCPVGPGKIGIVLCAGVNGAVAVEEAGVVIRTTPLSTLVDYTRMDELK